MTDEPLYRACVVWEDGDSDDQEDWEVYDTQVVRPWSEARAYMLAKLERWRTDTCPVCAANAAEAEADLRTRLEPQQWRWNIEGDDYWLIPPGATPNLPEELA